MLCAEFRKIVIAAEDFGATTRRSSGIKRLLRRTWEVRSLVEIPDLTSIENSNSKEQTAKATL
jgi:hypothetical protein